MEGRRRDVSGHLRRAVAPSVMVVSVLFAALVLAGCGPSVESLRESGDVDGLAAMAEKTAQYERREKAVAAIGEIGTPEAIRTLVGWVEARGPMWASAIGALGATGSSEAADVLAEQIDLLDPEDSVYGAELALLCSAVQAVDDPKVARALLRRVDSPNYRGPEDADLAVGLAGQGDDMVPELVKRLGSRDDDVYRPCAIALYDMSADDPAAVRRLLRNKKTALIWFGIFRRGDETGFEDDLIRALDASGGAPLASAMLNSHDASLEAAGRAWAQEHGYTIEQIIKYEFDH